MQHNHTLRSFSRVHGSRRVVYKEWPSLVPLAARPFVEPTQLTQQHIRKLLLSETFHKADVAVVPQCTVSEVGVYVP
jgi:hypothetical protein